MLISWKKQFVIATPTKCGTKTLEHRAHVHAMNISAFELDVVRPRMHRMEVPAGCGEFSRYLMVRNPYSRLVSIYEHLHGAHNYSQWANDVVKDMTFTEFLFWLSAQRAQNSDNHPTLGLRRYRAPWVWTDSLVTQYDVLRNHVGGASVVVPLRLEQLALEVRDLNVSWGMDIKAPTWSNASTWRQHGDWHQYYAGLGGGGQKKALLLGDEDYTRFAYSDPPW